MHEQSSGFRTLEEILDHPNNVDRDPHERHALYRRLSSKNFDELTDERRRADAANSE